MNCSYTFSCTGNEITSWFTLLTCFFVHTQFILGNWWIVYTSYGYWPLLWNMMQGTLYLLYPLCGWIAELYSKSFRTIQLSIILFFLSSVISLLGGSLTISIPFEGLHPDPDLTTFPLLPFFVGIYAHVCLVGLGMYESNAIQFGMDQMIEASSEQLSSFIHWYFWCAHSGPNIMYFTTMMYLYYESNCKQNWSEETAFGYIIYYLGLIILMTAVLQLVLVIIGIIATVCYKRKYHIEQISRNPLSIIVKVLQYSYRHKYPERRSALTYWENHMPSRIDLGKEKYGGPFTYEQVEDVKTVFRLLLVMGTVFGFHLSGDGYSFTSYLIKSVGCPTFIPFVMFTLNPIHIQDVIVILGVPLHQFVIKRYKFINRLTLLKRIWIGLLLCLISEMCQCFYVSEISPQELTTLALISMHLTSYNVL